MGGLRGESSPPRHEQEVLDVAATEGSRLECGEHSSESFGWDTGKQRGQGSDAIEALELGKGGAHLVL
jgi:hypothetical protein